MTAGVRVKALLRATELLGGRQKLCTRLGVSTRELDAWLAGREATPMRAFLAAVDIICALPATENERRRSDQVERSRQLRREASGVRQVAVLAKERAAAIHAAILQRREATVRAQPISPLRFLQARFQPSEGPEMVDAALDAAVQGTGADKGSMQLVCTDGLRIVAQRGLEQPYLDFFARVDADSWPGYANLEHGQRVVIPDVLTCPDLAGTPAARILADAHVCAVQSTPVVALSGGLLGMLSTHYERVCEPTPRELDLIDHIARRTAFWLEGGVA